MKNKNLAAILAILTGFVGGHIWYLGHTKSAAIRLLFFWTGIPFLVGFAEAIIFMSYTNAEFEKYLSLNGSFASDSDVKQTQFDILGNMFASLRNKLIAVFAVLSILIIVSMALSYLIINQTGQQYQTHNLFYSMKAKGVAIFLESQKVGRGISTSKITLAALINAYEKDMILLVKGGSYKILNSNYDLKPLSKNLSVFLPPLQQSWINYRKNAQTILKELPKNDSLIIAKPDDNSSSGLMNQPSELSDSASVATGSESGFTDKPDELKIENPTPSTSFDTQSNTIKVPNPKFLAALHYLEINVDALSQANQSFADALDKDVQIYSNHIKTITTIFLIIILVSLFICFYFVDKKIILPVADLVKLSEKRASGDFQLFKNFESEATEINKIATSIQTLSQKIEQAANFVAQIGSVSNTNEAINSNTEIIKTEDTLISRLFDMRDQIIKNDQIEKKRMYSAESIAYFSDLLRMDMSDSKTFYKKINSALAQRFDACQCVIFVALQTNQNTETHTEANLEINIETNLEMVAAYAFNREKFIEKNISAGDGMAGQAYLEQQTIYMTDLPESYLEIKSGLGHAAPRALLLVPMKNNGHVAGIIEMASFHEFDADKIELIEKIAENMATSVIAHNLADHTQKLLLEARQMTDQMRMQETQMRQNIEEMQTIQEENLRKERLMEKLNKDGLLREQELSTTNEEMRQNMEEMKIVQEQMYKLTKTAKMSENLLTDFSQHIPAILFQLAGSNGEKLKFKFVSESVEKYFDIKPQLLIDSGTDWQSLIESMPETWDWATNLLTINSNESKNAITQIDWKGYLKGAGQSAYIYVNIQAQASLKHKATTWNGIIVKQDIDTN